MIDWFLDLFITKPKRDSKIERALELVNKRFYERCFGPVEFGRFDSNGNHIKCHFVDGKLVDIV